MKASINVPIKTTLKSPSISPSRSVNLNKVLKPVPNLAAYMLPRRVREVAATHGVLCLSLAAEAMHFF